MTVQLRVRGSDPPFGTLPAIPYSPSAAFRILAPSSPAFSR